MLSYVSMDNSFLMPENTNNHTYGHKFCQTLSFYIFVNIILPIAIQTNHSLFTMMYLCYVILLCCNVGKHTFLSCIDSSSTEKDRRYSPQALSVHAIGSTGTHTGITNSVRKKESIHDQTYPMVESTPSTKKTIPPSTNGNREGADIIEQSQPGIPFSESQFYARTLNIPYSKRPDFNDRKADEYYSSPPSNEVFYDTIDDLNRYKDQMINNKGKKKLYQIFNITFYLYIVIPIKRKEEEKIIQNQELFISEPVDSKFSFFVN